MPATFHPVSWDSVALRPGLFQHRFDLNRSYLLSLNPAKLLQN